MERISVAPVRPTAYAGNASPGRKNNNNDLAGSFANKDLLDARSPGRQSSIVEQAQDLLNIPNVSILTLSFS